MRLLLLLLSLLLRLGLGMSLMMVVGSRTIRHWSIGCRRRRKTVGEVWRVRRGARRRTDEERRFFRARRKAS